MAKILRGPQCYGPEGRTGVKRTKFLDDFVLHDEGDPYVPGTNVPRVRRIRLGPKSVGYTEDDINRLIEGLRDWSIAAGAKRQPARPGRREEKEATA